VSHIGSSFEVDVVHDTKSLNSDFSVGLTDGEILGEWLTVIGPDIEWEATHKRGLPSLRDRDDFQIVGTYDYPSELPAWLDSDPVERLIRVSAESSWAKRLLLTPRVFPGLEPWCTESISSFFRPAFDDGHELTPLPQNTIAAYLLRNLLYRDSIFEALKQQVAVKAAAVNDLIDSELAAYQQAFNRRFPPRE
jgi:hypothetical protein